MREFDAPKKEFVKKHPHNSLQKILIFLVNFNNTLKFLSLNEILTLNRKNTKKITKQKDKDKINIFIYKTNSNIDYCSKW
jgi:hypothetical protein